MADDDNGPQGSDDSQQGGDGDGGTGSQQGASGTQKGADGGKFPPEVQAILDKANREAAAARKELTAARRRLDEIDAASKTDLQKAQERAEAAEKRAADLEANLRRTTTGTVVRDTATRLGFVDPGDAYALIAESITYDDDGKATNVDNLLKDLATRKPYLVGRRSVNGGEGNSGGGGSPDDMNSMLRKLSGRA